MVDLLSTQRICADDPKAGFRCGQHPLDDYFKRHALANDQLGASCAYVMRRSAEHPPSWPKVLGFYTLSMSLLEASQAAPHLEAAALPRYPLPVALVGRLAVDKRVHGQKLGVGLLLDALRRVLRVSDHIGCVGVVVDAKHEDAERFYRAHGFTTLQGQEAWPRKMFLPIQHARAALSP